MGNTSRELSANSPAGFFNHVQSPQGSMPASPVKSASRSAPSFAYDTPTATLFDGHSAARRHSVHSSVSAVRMVPQLRLPFGQRTNNQDVVFYELDDDDDTSASDDASSPQLHRKVQRSRSEPKGPVGVELVSQSQLQVQNQHSNRYKTELCRAFLEAGHCKYGDKCQFAHGDREMRNVSRHPKYKTEYCRSFHATGLCAYGPRCHFIHNPDELNQLLGTPRRTSASSISEKTTTSGSTVAAAGARPRAISLSAFPPVPSQHRAIPEQLLELGSCGNSRSTVSSAGSCYSGSYESSPLSMSPGVGMMGCGSSYEEYGWRSSNSGLDGLTANHQGEPNVEDVEPWALDLANRILQDFE